MMRGRWRSAAILAVAGALALGSAQARQQQFRGRIDVVSVDAFVTDPQGRFVGDLKPSDFEIKEQGKVQSIETFKLIRLDEPPGDEPGPAAITSDQDIAAQAARDDIGLFVIFLDDYHVERANSERARDQLAQFVSRINVRDLVAIVYPTTSVPAIAFSHDRVAQVRTIKAFTGRKYDYYPMNAFEKQYQCAPPAEQERIRGEVADSALTTLFAHLGTLSDRRKTVVDVSEGPTGRLPARLLNAPGACPDQEAAQLSRAMAAPSAGRPAPGSLQPAYIQAAIEHNVRVDTLDPRGTTADDLDIRDSMDDAAARRSGVDTAHEALRNLAHQTGGRAIVGVNQYDDALQQVLRESSAYYLLGYTSTLAKHDGRFHELAVRVKRPGLTVSARKGYWAWTDEAIAAASAPATGPRPDVKAALDTLASAGPGAAIRLWTGTSLDADGRPTVTVVWEETGAGPAPVSSVTIRPSAGASDPGPAIRIPADGQSGIRGGQATFAASPGPLALRVVATDANGTEVDTARRELVVPDVPSATPSISTPQVFVARSPRDMQMLRAAAAPRASASRAFSRTDRLLIRFAVFDSGRPAAVTLRVLGANGQALVDLPAPSGVAKGVFESELGLAWLASGDYVVEIRAGAAADGASALVPLRIQS
jgi:VWFA-related protein